MSSKSRVISLAAPGCRILTATTVSGSTPAAFAPAAESVALWTWATDPEATGSLSKESKTVDRGPPNAASTAATDASAECLGASDCSLRRAFVTCGGKRSPRVAAHWPHLMKAGPAAASVEARRELHASRRGEEEASEDHGEEEEKEEIWESARTSGSDAAAGKKSSVKKTALPQVAASSARAASRRASEAASGVRPRRESADEAEWREARAGTRGAAEEKKRVSSFPLLFRFLLSKQAAKPAPRGPEAPPPPTRRAVGTATASLLARSDDDDENDDDDDEEEEEEELWSWSCCCWRRCCLAARCAASRCLLAAAAASPPIVLVPVLARAVDEVDTAAESCEEEKLWMGEREREMGAKEDCKSFSVSARGRRRGPPPPVRHRRAAFSPLNCIFTFYRARVTKIQKNLSCKTRASRWLSAGRPRRGPPLASSIFVFWFRVEGEEEV